MKIVYNSSIQVYQISNNEFIMIDKLLMSTICIFKVNLKNGCVFDFISGSCYCYDLMETYQHIIDRVISKLTKEVQ